MTRKKTISAMPKVWLVTVMFIVCFYAVEAKADSVVFNTFMGVGVTNASGGLDHSSYTYGSGGDTVTISILPRDGVHSPWNTVDLVFGSCVPVPTDFGVINVSFTGNGATLPSVAAMFLGVSQISPSQVGGSQWAQFPLISGTLSPTINTLVVNFNQPAHVFYTIDNGEFWYNVLDAQMHLVPGDNLIQGQITSPTPEPATLVLLCTGLAGIAMKVKRRKKQGSI